MKTLVEDEELKRLRAMADGSRPFEVIGKWEKLSELAWRNPKALPPREKLGVGYYQAGRRYAEQMKGDE